MYTFGCDPEMVGVYKNHMVDPWNIISSSSRLSAYIGADCSAFEIRPGWSSDILSLVAKKEEGMFKEEEYTLIELLDHYLYKQLYLKVFDDYQIGCRSAEGYGEERDYRENEYDNDGKTLHLEYRSIGCWLSSVELTILVLLITKVITLGISNNIRISNKGKLSSLLEVWKQLKERGDRDLILFPTAIERFYNGSLNKIDWNKNILEEWGCNGKNKLHLLQKQNPGKVRRTIS